VDFKRIGGTLIGVTLLLALLSILGNLILKDAVAQQQQPGATIALVLRLLVYASVAGLVICAVITAITEQQVTKAILPAGFAVASLVLILSNSDFGFSALAATIVTSITVFGGEKTEPVWQKNAVTTYSLIGLVAFNVGLASSLTAFTSVSIIGVLLGVPAFLMALIYPLQRREWGWIALLVIVALCGPALVLITGHRDVGLLFLPMTAVTAVRGLVWSDSVTDRHAFGTMALLGVVMIIGGGTLVNSVFSTVPNQPPILDPLKWGNSESVTFFAGFDMYIAAGILALIAWVFSVMYAGRNAMWGWLVTALLLPGVGALLLGFFGPTPQDYQQTKASAAAKRAAGV
jgi:hypothetical protein